MNSTEKMLRIIKEYAQLAYLSSGEDLGNKIKGKKVYLSGQITGNANYKGLFGFAYTLITLGDASEVYNPAARIPDNVDYKSAMKRCITELVKCDTIVILPNAYESKGARLEKEVAISCGLDVVTLSNNAIITYSFNAVEEALKRLL
jgi:hypothetical protein|nr:MAG TPA: N-deoxyribosyltransferase [Caudoviricetes sp.]